MKTSTKGKTSPPGPHWPAGDAPINIGDWFKLKPVFNEKCTYCLLCWLLCPDGAIIQLGDKKLGVDESLCKNCGICVQECPIKAVEMVSKSNNENKK
ncbi:4Fe-4S binding protein [Chloroflexota bacterium]